MALVCLALMAAFPVPAPAAGLAPGYNMTPAATEQVVGAQFPGGGFLNKLKAFKGPKSDPKSGPGIGIRKGTVKQVPKGKLTAPKQLTGVPKQPSTPAGGPKQSTGVPQQQPLTPRDPKLIGVPQPPTPPRDPKLTGVPQPPTPPGRGPGSTDHLPTDPGGPRQPSFPRPFIFSGLPVDQVFPGLPAEQAEVLRTLPRHTQQPPPQGGVLPERVARQILVLVDATQPPQLTDQLAQAYGLELLASRPIALLAARAELFRVRPGRSETAVLAALQRDVRVRSAQFNMRYFHSDDGRRESSVPIPQYAPVKLHLPQAHQLALGRNVPIAVIDSAVDTGHPDLAGGVVRTFDAVGGPDLAPDFHGTAVAGIIRSRGIVQGVAPQAELLAVRAFTTKPGALPETTSFLLLDAIDWASRNGAKVLNMSFVGPRDRGVQEGLEAAGRKGIVLVAAAGNAGPKAPPAYPAAYPGVIAVTAVDAADKRYRHANRGRYIAIAAPGVDVLAPVEGGRHELVSGTSFATAYVSGIAALLLERDPTLDATSIAQLIAAGAEDLGPAGRDDDFGAGRANALATLKSVREIAAR